MNRKAFVLFSGGLDSTVTLAMAMKAFNRNVEAVSFDYGQRHIKETLQAKKICEHYNISHTILNLRGLLDGDDVLLTNKDAKVPDVSYDDIVGISPVFVPFRNGLMLSALTAHAQKYVNSEVQKEEARILNDGFSEESAKVIASKSATDLCAIYCGVHAEDATNWAYPDCTPEFVGAMANAIYIGSYFSIRLLAPFIHSSKTDIVRKGYELSAPVELSWSCYKGEEFHCGVCPTCRSRKDAFAIAGIYDPTTYREEFPF